MRPVILLATAEDDLDAGERFYETQEEGLGDHFLATLKLELRSLAVHGGSHRKMYGFHRAISKRFPHAMFYRVEKDEVRVYAVLDCRRDPAEVRRRLRGL